MTWELSERGCFIGWHAIGLPQTFQPGGPANLHVYVCAGPVSSSLFSSLTSCLSSSLFSSLSSSPLFFPLFFPLFSLQNQRVKLEREIWLEFCQVAEIQLYHIDRPGLQNQQNSATARPTCQGRQYVNIGWFCPLPLCTSIGRFRVCIYIYVYSCYLAQLGLQQLGLSVPPKFHRRGQHLYAQSVLSLSRRLRLWVLHPTPLAHLGGCSSIMGSKSPTLRFTGIAIDQDGDEKVSSCDPHPHTKIE